MIDIKTINKSIEQVPMPPYCEVDEEEWRNALMGAQESFSQTDLDGFDTEKLWSMIYFSAVYFCKGMIHAEIKAGLRGDNNYPRY